MSLLTAQNIVAVPDGQASDTITLDENGRHRRRMTMTSDNGPRFLLDLAEAALLRHGDGLLLSDGRIVEVRAKPEPLFRIEARDREHLLRLTWHLGNRHCPTEINENALLIRQDHTLRDMLEGLGATVTEVEASFDPEGGAYDGAQGHHHHHHD